MNDMAYTGGGEAKSGKGAISKLLSYIPEANLVPMLDKDVVSKIGMEVVRGYDQDKISRAEWERLMEKAMELAMQVSKEKSWPWPKAANVKYPLLTTAAIQFSARAYPAIVQGAQVVKGMFMGPDTDEVKADRATRIGEHMSYQLLQQIDGWDEDTDRLLLQMSIVGCAFRKTYFDPAEGMPCSELVPAKYVVYDHCTPWRNLKRISQYMLLTHNDVIERIRGGLFEEVKLTQPMGESDDPESPYEFIEQHCWYDLDGDGYKEPYIVTVVKETSEVARIVARFDEDGIKVNGKGQVAKIGPVSYWTKYQFMPNPDGGSYDVGLGILLNPLNEAVNTVLNQMLDAGTLANTGGGFIGRGLNLKGGAARFTPGEFKPVDMNGRAIAESIYHMQFPGPNAVLFQLLGLLIEAGKDISSVKDIMLGDQQTNQTATTTLALIEQGQKVFSAIYKRVHRSLGEEFQKLYRLNRLYLEPKDYFRFQDEVKPIYLEDYQGDGTDVAPVSDPNLASDTQEMMRAEAMMTQFKGDPFINQVELRRKYLKAMKENEIDKLLIEEPPAPPPDPKVMEVQANIAAQQVEVNMKAEKNAAEVDQIAAQTANTQADTALKLAQAQATDPGMLIGYLQTTQQMMADTQAAVQQMIQSQQPPQGEVDDDAGRVPGMGGAPADTEVPPVSAGLPGAVEGEMEPGGLQPAEPGISDGDIPLPDGAGIDVAG